MCHMTCGGQMAACGLNCIGTLTLPTLASRHALPQHSTPPLAPTPSSPAAPSQPPNPRPTRPTSRRRSAKPPPPVQCPARPCLQRVSASCAEVPTLRWSWRPSGPLRAPELEVAVHGPRHQPLRRRPPRHTGDSRLMPCSQGTRFSTAVLAKHPPTACPQAGTEFRSHGGR